MDWKLSCIVLLAVATVCSAQGYGATCSYGGATFPPGPFQYKCHECTCSARGVPNCKPCPKPCLYNGQVIPSGESYKIECNSCNCMNGVGACTRKGCIPYVGLCPKMVDSGVCYSAPTVCYDDWHCARNEKCCDCGGTVRKCVPAVSPPERPGFCPKTASGVVGTCHEDCYYDQDCKKGFKCCSNGCGHTCVLPLLECSIIKEPTYTTITYSTAGIPVTGTIASYTCHPGYKLSVYGVDSQTCSIDGQWVGVMPICVPVDCGKPTDISYGTVNYYLTTYGEKATYTCNIGYILVGVLNTRTCEATGYWSTENIVCKPDVCEYLPSIKYGKVMYTTTILIPGTVATLNCNEGYMSNGVTMLTCGDNLQWNGIFTCVPVMCPKLDYIINGGVKLTGTTPGSTAAYYCNQGYTLDSLTKRTCGITGHWSGTEPTCIQVDCGKPMDISYGTVKYISTLFGSTATYMCLEGYILVGAVNTRTCEATGYWSKENIVCKQVDCGVPDEVMYGTVEFTTTTYGSVASYTCNQGYYCVGIYTTKCEINGLWIGELPVCKVRVIHIGSCPKTIYNKDIICGNNFCYDDEQCLDKEKCCECGCIGGGNRCITAELRTCTVGDVVYNSGDTYTVECNECVCTDGVGSCQEMACTPNPGTCPGYRSIYGACPATCAWDGDCGLIKKCCKTSCGYTCETPSPVGGYGK